MSFNQFVKLGEFAVLWSITFCIVYANTLSVYHAAVSASVGAPTKWTALQFYYWGVGKLQ